jgi:DNA-binding transcriptional regulator YiaG
MSKLVIAAIEAHGTAAVNRAAQPSPRMIRKGAPSRDASMASAGGYSKSYNFSLQRPTARATVEGMLAPRRLKEIRVALDLSQEEMARLLGVSFATVNRWENDNSSPTGTVAEVYRALDVALRGGTPPKRILGTEPMEPGRLLHRIFQLAYGGR